MRLIGPLLLLVLAAGTARATVGALQTDCGLGGQQADGSYQFVSGCEGRAVSPDGAFAIVLREYDGSPPIVLQDGQGQTLAPIPELADGMPFRVSWAPDSRWLYVNHHVGSFMDTIRVFEVVDNSLVARTALVESVLRVATSRYPCLAPGMINPNGVRWMPDGHRIVVVTISRPDACSADWTDTPGEWRPLWMIGDIRSGIVEPESIRVQPADAPFQMPTDGPYAAE